MRKKIKKHSYKIIVFFIFILFFLFLVSISIFNNSNLNLNLEDDKVKTTLDKSSYIIEKTKYETITSNILYDFSNVKIEDLLYNQYFQYLILTNQIKNRQNSLAQEVIGEYLQDNLSFAKQISKKFINEYLLEFDSSSDIKWRNHRLELYDEEMNLLEILYENSHLILNQSKSNILGYYQTNISLFEFEEYTFKFKNNLTKKVRIDLKTKKGEEKLNEYLEFINDTYKPKFEFESINTSFIKSNKTYILKFVIWS